MGTSGSDQHGLRKPERRTHARSGVLWFLVLFVVYLVVGNALLSLSFVQDDLVRPWTAFNAAGSAGLARAVGIEARADGTQVDYGSGTLNILVGCNGVEALLILIAALLAFPSPWLWRVLGVLLGAVVVLGANLVRLVNLIAVAKFRPSWLEVFHIYIWQALIVLVAFAYFLAWEYFIARVRPVSGPSGDT